MTTQVAEGALASHMGNSGANAAAVRSWHDLLLKSKPWRGPLLATLLLHVALMGLYLFKCRGDASIFLCAGANHVGTAPYEAVTQARGPSGHDGQFYYAAARAPWRVHVGDIDAPAGRHLRILYPALCWCLSGGDPVLLFYVMPLVNLLAIVAMAWIGVRVAQHYGRNPWWGFVLPLALNAGISLLHDFTDCVSGLAVVGLLASWILGQRWWAVSLWAAAAMFSREQNVAVAGLIGVAALWKGRWAVAASVAAAGGLWLAWVGTLWISYGTPPFLGNCFTPPFTGLMFRLQHLGDNGLQLFHPTGAHALVQHCPLAHPSPRGNLLDDATQSTGSPFADGPGHAPAHPGEPGHLHRLLLVLAGFHVGPARHLAGKPADGMLPLVFFVPARHSLVAGRSMRYV